jgi:hypothetical protein
MISIPIVKSTAEPGLPTAKIDTMRMTPPRNAALAMIRMIDPLRSMSLIK